MTHDQVKSIKRVGMAFDMINRPNPGCLVLLSVALSLHSAKQTQAPLTNKGRRVDEM
jgi:hypothetical protein